MRFLAGLLGGLALLSTADAQERKQMIATYESGMTFWQPYNIGQTVTLTWTAASNKGYRDIWLTTYHETKLNFSLLITTKVNVEAQGQFDWTISGVPSDVLKITDGFIIRYKPTQADSGTTITYRPDDDTINSVGFVLQAAVSSSSASTTSSASSTSSSGASSTSQTASGTSGSPGATTTSTGAAGTGGGAGNGSTGGGEVKETSAPQENLTSQQQQQQGGSPLSGGSLAGVVIGAVVGAGVVGGLVVWALLRLQGSRRAKHDREKLQGGESDHDVGAGGPGKEGYFHDYVESPPEEVLGDVPRRELEGKQVHSPSELDSTTGNPTPHYQGYSEMPAGNLTWENDGAGAGQRQWQMQGTAYHEIGSSAVDSDALSSNSRTRGGQAWELGGGRLSGNGR